ncbi:MAG: T9SS type A sorting domain-containing protein [bacterium]|nr:T9SS type A sorting domain-containing protein [bacterium]
MQRWFRLSSLLLVLTAAFTLVRAQDYVEVRGSLATGQVRVFVRDTIYRISGTYTIGGTLVIEPGTRVEFLPNGRLIDSTGGRIIADGRMTATYNAAAVNPLFPPYTGYDDPAYFGAPGVVTSTIAPEPTIHTSKYGVVFNVDLGTDPNLQQLTPAEAVLYKAARLEQGGVITAIRLNPWFRQKLGSSINVRPARITFIAGDVNNFSREWGHIVVLPGSRAAFFRDVDFRNFRKDTTVDNEPIYLRNSSGQALSRTQAEAANDNLLRASNGGGGAITTFSVRTWLVGCTFINNMARFRGGALQVLQAPVDQYVGSTLQLYPVISAQTIAALPTYPNNVNPWLTDPENAQPIVQNLKSIDNLYDVAAEPMTDVNRQSLDDARLAMYLGRIRQLRFTNNRALNSDVGLVTIGGIRFVTDVNQAATVHGTLDRSRKNEASGGAVYISGRDRFTVGFGVNDMQGKDTLEFTGNYAENRQPTDLVGANRTMGARGGAVHVADNTAVIFAGRYTSNKTTVPFIKDMSTDNLTTSITSYSHGGAIYASPNAGQISVRGNLDNNPPTHFLSNESARGGAIYVATGIVDTLASPIVGGSDGIINARNYGFNIKFRDNKASADGGAIFTGRNMRVYGAGGASGPLWIYGTNYGVEFTNNTAGYSGGAVAVHQPQAQLPIWRRVVRLVRSTFVNNRVGEVADSIKDEVRGGGGYYSINSDLNVVKGTEFRNNKAFNGNGGAVSIVSPDTLTRKRFFVSDLDSMMYNAQGVALGYMARNDVFTFQTITPRADERMLTRFYENIAVPNPSRQGSGTTQRDDVLVRHPVAGIRENGTGLGGALYILDSIRVRVDTFGFDRVRMQNNTAYTGAAIYSDNYDLKLGIQRCLITGNRATSDIGRLTDTITGPVLNGNNLPSSDLAGAVLYGEVTGPLPWTLAGTAANSIYDNFARFIIRLPDAQDTKGVLAGTTGIGFGGVDTLRGNYWGRTEANVNTVLPLSQNQTFQRVQETFFIQGNGKTHLNFKRNATVNLREQGPFESTYRYNYKPIPIYEIPDTLLLAGRIYDIFDKGTDIKTADYSRRRMSPIEDFAVGIPPYLKMYTDPLRPSFNKYVKRTTRNPFDAEMDPFIARVQTEFVGNHPIGYPVFLEARADYSSTAEISNNDTRAFNETVFFVINQRTGDYIRMNLRQKGLTDTIFRARAELVPDSTNGGDPNIRRAFENLATYGSGATLLARLADNGIAEDSSALPGRRWEGSTVLGELGGPNFRLGNRPALPTSNNVGGDGGKETYFGGERYRALPVREGDEVIVVSRTILWKEGVVAAINGALSFIVGNNTIPPVFTGSADTLGTAASIHPAMRNRVFVTENRLYTPITAAQSLRADGNGSWFNEPASYPADSAGVPIPSLDWTERDTIFTITATDTNQFFDPRVIFDSTRGSYLSYFYSITDPASALKYWLRDTLVKASNADNMAWGATGYRILRGRPINPYIVPGGEEIEVVAKNFPPTLELVDSLRNSGFPEEMIAKWIYLYPSYFHAEAYDNNSIPLDQRNPDNTNARFLQQDTVNLGFIDSTSYRFRIHVVDSLPRFLWAHPIRSTTEQQYTSMLKGDTTIVLDPTTTDSTVFANGVYLDTLRMLVSNSRVGRRFVQPNAIVDEVYNNPANNQPDTVNIQFVANLTDSLRFMLDVNTDDEFEDNAAVDPTRAVVQKYGAWDFRFGKTAYGFQSTSIRETPGDTVIDEVRMSRPIWMSNQYLRRYANAGQTDAFAQDFTATGRINIRISNAEAREILKPINDLNPGNPISGDLNTDSIVSIVVNDGHGGLTTLTRRVFVNVQPTILTTSLPGAIEDQDYNHPLLDSARRIKVYDPNFGQWHEFTLIYPDLDSDSTPDSVAVDPYFAEAGFINLIPLKTTPRWLKIDPKSGLLYGTPRVTDLPFSDTTVQVTVMVTDAGKLVDVKTVSLTISAVNHDPRLFSSPVIRCVDLGDPYADTIRVSDLDLKRRQNQNEILTFRVIEPEPVSQWSFIPQQLTSEASDTQKVVISSTSLQGTPDSKGRIKIRVVVTDRAGISDTLEYYVSVSDATRFAADIRVENSVGAFQVLTFGVQGTSIATRGDEDGAYGKLDSNYCEYELPPVPIPDIFDARWTIPTRQGILRSIFPFSNQPGEAVYRARFQAGGSNGQSGEFYPVKLSWCRGDIPARDATNPGSYYIRDDQSNGSLFNYNMKLGNGRSVADITHTSDGTCDVITIFRTSVEGFVIVYDFTTPVEEEKELSNTLAIVDAAPNPFTTSTAITFNAPGTKKVNVEIFDAIGVKVATLASEVFTAGRHTIDWNGTSNGTSMSSGLYTVRISDGVTSATQQIVLVR